DFHVTGVQTCALPISLNVPGEVVWRIPPMALAPRSDGTASDAVALLIDRAEAARGGRPAGPEELPHLHRIAQGLDGLPLALELAAAKLRLFSAAQLDRKSTRLNSS